MSLRFRSLSLKTFDGETPQFLTHARMLAQTGLDPDATIFSLDTEALAIQLESLPELTGAKVSRRLPGTLKIEVQERHARSLGGLPFPRNQGA